MTLSKADGFTTAKAESSGGHKESETPEPVCVGTHTDIHTHYSTKLSWIHNFYSWNVTGNSQYFFE